jgi:hypothetical protein
MEAVEAVEEQLQRPLVPEEPEALEVEQEE